MATKKVKTAKQPKSKMIQVDYTGIKIFEGYCEIYKGKSLGEHVIILKQKSPILNVKTED